MYFEKRTHRMRSLVSQHQLLKRHAADLHFDFERLEIFNHWPTWIWSVGHSHSDVLPIGLSEHVHAFIRDALKVRFPSSDGRLFLISGCFFRELSATEVEALLERPCVSIGASLIAEDSLVMRSFAALADAASQQWARCHPRAAA